MSAKKATNVKATVREDFSADDAKKLLGWEEEKEGQDFGDKFDLKIGKRKVRLTNNPSNRPYRPALGKRYANEILRKKWKLNGETIISDSKEHIQSGQHRLVGLVLAEEERKAHPKVVADRFGWRGPITIPVILVSGISNHPSVVDTLDLGQKRSLGDVIYRRHEFRTGKELSPGDVKKLSNILSVAIRLVWLRAGGKTVSDAKHFPHSEALDFLGQHPKLVDAVSFIYSEDQSDEGQRIRSKISLGYAAALLYLAGTSSTDLEKAEEPDTKLWGKSEEFWVLFASEAGLADGHPALALSKALRKVDASGAMGRDEVVGLAVKAINAFFDGSKLDAKTIRMKRVTNPDTGKRELGEEPRLGGYDRVVEPETIKTVNGWKVGDTAWVADPNGAWFGTIQGFEDLETAEIYSKDDDDTYSVPVEDLREDQPEEEEEETEE